MVSTRGWLGAPSAAGVAPGYADDGALPGAFLPVATLRLPLPLIAAQTAPRTRPLLPLTGPPRENYCAHHYTCRHLPYLHIMHGVENKQVNEECRCA
ncbi:hypothetical protein E2C01_062691 [Portunus trituberculatus]|uniref:Uncharacterized protein n=1 Tax=Portunus trituberculatus TaxID=210409 RepID=A0A5B7HFD6_PORTR|nr:hypothetical protein [Portunus trituberculatus]